MSFFCDKTNGVNADILRHALKQQYLEGRIRELESIEEPDDFDKACLLGYRQFLKALLDSKAEVVSNIGRKK